MSNEKEKKIVNMSLFFNNDVFSPKVTLRVLSIPFERIHITKQR